MSDSDSDDDNLSLCRACQQGRIRRVTELLANGVDVDEQGQTFVYGLVTPLQAAVSSAELRIAELLIDKGANMSVLYDNGESLLIRASRMMFDHIQYHQPHLMADLLIRKGADVGYRHRHATPLNNSFIMNTMPLSQNNWNALHVAAYHGNSEVVEVLLNHGADVLALTSAGERAEELALKDYILKVGFETYCRSEIDRYTQNYGAWRGTREKSMEYLGYVRGYDETVRLLQVAERQLAFAMGHHPRLGGGSSMKTLSPDMLRTVLRMVQ